MARSFWVLLLFAASCTREKGEEFPGSPSPSVSATAQPLAVVVPWKVGRRYAYRLELTSALGFGEQPNAFDFDVAGKLVIAPSAAEGNEATLFMILENAGITSRVPDPEGQFRVIADHLSRFGCYVTFREGRVTEMRFSPELPTMVVSIYRQIAASLQATMPPGDRVQFETNEYDGTGEYKALYERTADGTWKKRKLQYSKLLGKSTGFAMSAFQNLVPEIRASSTELRLADDGRPVRIQGRDELTIRGAQAPVRSTTSISLQADAITSDSPVKDWRELGKKLTLLRVDEPYVQTSKTQNSKGLDEARIAGQSFESVFGKLKEATLAHKQRSPSATPTDGKAEPVVEQGETAQFVALTAMFRQREEDVSKAVQRIRKDPAMAITLIDALASSGSPAAHKALAEMLTANGVEPKHRVRALGGLSRTPVPSPVAVQALRDELARSPFNVSALLGLGSYARFYRERGDTAREAALGELLLEQFKKTEDIVPRVVVTLQAIANSGYLGALGVVKRRMQDSRPPVRAAAMRALQLMPGSEIDQLLASAIRGEKEARVAVAALTSTRTREPSDVLVQALTSAAETSEEPKVRYESIAILGRWRKNRPEMRDVIQRVASNDAEESIRRLAQSLL